MQLPSGSDHRSASRRTFGPPSPLESWGGFACYSGCLLLIETQLDLKPSAILERSYSDVSRLLASYTDASPKAGGGGGADQPC